MNASDRDLIEASLEALAERTEDLTPPVYERFFARHPEFEPLFVDELGRGRMLNELIVTLTELAEDRSYAAGAIACLAQDHRAYADDISLAVYRDFTDALLEVMAELMGEDWTSETDGAWRRQRERLLSCIADGLGASAAA